MRVVEAAGRTVDEAVRDALRQLGADREDVDVEVLEEGSKGLFGLLGSRRARVRVQLKPGAESRMHLWDDEEDDETALDGDEPSADVEELDAEGARPAAAADRPSDGDRDRQLSSDDLRVLDDKLERAGQFVAGVLERLEVDAGLELRLDDDGIGTIHIVGDELGLVIGRRGQTLDALQFLTNQAANREGGPWARIVVDAGGYRQRRAEALEGLAGRMADRALREGRKIALEPMNAFERRIVHLSLADDEAVETYSEGEDPHRRIIIAPKRLRGSAR